MSEALYNIIKDWEKPLTQNGRCSNIDSRCTHHCSCNTSYFRIDFQNGILWKPRWIVMWQCVSNRRSSLLYVLNQKWTVYDVMYCAQCNIMLHAAVAQLLYYYYTRYMRTVRHVSQRIRDCVFQDTITIIYIVYVYRGACTHSRTPVQQWCWRMSNRRRTSQ